MRKISFATLFVLVVASCFSCMPEVQPILKPRVLSIDQRIAEQEKWLDQYIADKAIPAPQARVIRDKIEQIRGKYKAFQAAGKLTPEQARAINRMLDDTSEQIFFSIKKKKKLLP
ncbi:MAG: hypothetical protein ACP5IL_09280 [Syntrophobacteraceae bacterium]